MIVEGLLAPSTTPIFGGGKNEKESEYQGNLGKTYSGPASEFQTSHSPTGKKEMPNKKGTMV